MLKVESPYIFYQFDTELVFLFYVYEGCLLCKIFNDEIFNTATKTSDTNKMFRVKELLEQNTRAYFIDGNLDNTSIQEELHGFFNEDTNEVMASGNIIFRYSFAIDQFNQNRTIPSQRVCAYSSSKNHVRVFYKHSSSVNLKSAIWTGVDWLAEDFLRDSSNLDTFEAPVHIGASLVTGGFGGTGFGTVVDME